ncbi:hypothetical protein [Haloferula sp. BvORR071]|uniref:hypothetical protein n=1 Tax=Haloferula sp. BvORR071 TaxID=1396141 RepID=UPI00054F38E6|nr:hypothetical protein [Haloferula sp. BvORR071]
MNATTTLQSLCCQGCGAPLSIGKGSRLVRCGYCARQAQIAETPDPGLAGQLENLKLREDLRELDSAWEKYKLSVSSRDQRGAYHSPSAGTAFGYLVLGGFVTLLACLALGAMASPWSFLIAVPIGIWITRHFWSAELERVNAFISVRDRYAARRADLVRRLGVRN